jgi:hypothetical protein
MTNEQSGIHDCCDRCIGPGGAGVFAGGVRRAGGSRISTGRIGHSSGTATKSSRTRWAPVDSTSAPCIRSVRARQTIRPTRSPTRPSI